MKSIGIKRFLLALAVVLVFGRSLFSDFVDWDDGYLICHNSTLNPPTAEGFKKHWEPHDPSNFEMYNPLVYSAWWCLAQVSQLRTADTFGSTLNPMEFHAANLLVQIVSALIVMQILRSLGLRPPAAFAGAMIFAIHPIQTEAVVWASAMKDLMAGLFSLLAIWRYILSARATRPGRQRLEYALASLAFVAALLAKPSTVAVPLMLAAIDLILLRRPWRKTLALLAPWCAVGLGFVLLAKSIQPSSGRIDPVPIYLRPLIATDAITFYLYKLVAPWNYYIDYGRTPVAMIRDGAFHHALYWSWVAPVLVALVLWRLRRRELTVAALLFGLGLLPVLGLVPFAFQTYSTVADRYVYISMLGVSLALGFVVQKSSGRATTVVVGIVFLMLGYSGFVQAGIWKDTQTLFAYSLAQNPDNFRGYLNAGLFEVRQAETERNLAQNASSAAEKTEHLRLEQAELEDSVRLFRKSLEVDPSASSLSEALAKSLIRLHRKDEAAVVLQAAIDNYPAVNRGDQLDKTTLYLELGFIYEEQKQWQRAIKQFEHAIAIQDTPLAEKHLSDVLGELAASRPTTA